MRLLAKVVLGLSCFALLIVLPSCGGGMLDFGAGCEREDCSINVTSVPSGARITLDGVVTGLTTPHVFSHVEPGMHTVAVSLAGYQDAQEQRDVPARQNWNLRFVLVSEEAAASAADAPPAE
ncbi:MAG: PEGA domain-containing protein [Armatimonadota bacterium]